MANTMVRMILTIVKLCPKDSLVKLYNIARKIRYMPRGIHNSLELSADLFFVYLDPTHLSNIAEAV